MAKKTRISRIDSLPLTKAFSNAKIVHKISEYKSPGILARILLEAFLFEDGDINSDWFVREKVCTKGSFTKLRDRLIKDQWLHFREDSKRYFPGVRLKPHLDVIRESKAATLADMEAMDAKKADRSDLDDLDARKADKSEFAEVKDEVQDLKARMNAIEFSVSQMIPANEPPDTPEKQKVRADALAKIAALSKN